MREIKFRAWDGQDMYQVDGLGFYNDQPIAISGISNIDESRDVELPDDSVLMQYTGLEDKNGTEIYEGDILSDGKNHAVVTWSEGDLGYFLNDIDEHTHPRGSKDEPAYIIDDSQGWIALEVIGNIYENKELLK
jgi:uncharacterized phage protein (TIGR01671 family)